MTTSTPTVPEPRRRWFQFSLRTLLIGVALAGCGFGWLGAKVREGRQQAAVVEAIRKKGGLVYFDYQVRPGGLIPHATLPEPAWLRELLGDDCFRNVVGVVYLMGNQDRPADATVGDNDLARIKVLTRLEFLWLIDTQVTDAGAADLRGLTQLKELNLVNTAVSDAGLESLQGLTRLTHLHLEGTKVTDRGLETLNGLTQLEKLSLGDTTVTPDGIIRLQQALPKCQITQ